MDLDPSILSLAMALAISAAAHKASAQQQRLDPVATWLTTQIERASIPDVSGLEIRFEVVTGERPTPGALAIVRSRVEGHPDHPDRALLTRMEEWARNGPSREEKRVWFSDASHWRLCQNLQRDSAPAFFSDAGQLGAECWVLTPDQIGVSQPSDTGGHDYSVYGGAIEFMLSAVATHDLWRLKQEGQVVTAASLQGDTWMADLAEREMPTKRHIEYRVQGSWDSSASVGVIDSIELTRWDAAPSCVGIRTTFSDCDTLTLPGGGRLCMASTSSCSEQPGQSVRVLAVERSNLNVAQLGRTPIAGASDPIRGVIKVRSMVDHRPGAESRMTFSEEGSLQSRVPLREGRYKEILRWAGWAVLGGGVVLLIVYRKRRIARSLVGAR